MPLGYVGAKNKFKKIGLGNDGQIGFTHCVDWSSERPVPENCFPKVGQKLRAKVFHITESSDEPLPADVTFDGKFQVDFAASFALLQPKPEDESV